MSIQTDIEQQIGIVLQGAIPGIAVSYGSTAQPSVEGDQRAAVVRAFQGTATRLRFGQTQWEEAYAVTCYWRPTVDRNTRMDEWQAFADSLLVNQYLQLGIDGLIEAWLSESAWGEATDGGYATMVATVSASRVE